MRELIGSFMRDAVNLGQTYQAQIEVFRLSRSDEEPSERLWALLLAPPGIPHLYKCAHNIYYVKLWIYLPSEPVIRTGYPLCLRPTPPGRHFSLSEPLTAPVLIRMDGVRLFVPFDGIDPKWQSRALSGPPQQLGWRRSPASARR